MLTAHIAKTDNNLKSFLKNKLRSIITKKNNTNNSETNNNIMNSIVKNNNFDFIPEVFKTKSITANLKVDNEKLRNDLNTCFDMLGKEFKMASVSDEEDIISK